MSHTEPDPDLVRIGESPEWIELLERALAHFEAAWRDEPWQPIGIRPESLGEITLFNERSHVRDDLAPLVRTAVRDYVIGIHPWEFTP